MSFFRRVFSSSASSSPEAKPPLSSAASASAPPSASLSFLAMEPRLGVLRIQQPSRVTSAAIEEAVDRAQREHLASELVRRKSVEPPHLQIAAVGATPSINNSNSPASPLEKSPMPEKFVTNVVLNLSQLPSDMFDAVFGAVTHEVSDERTETAHESLHQISVLCVMMHQQLSRQDCAGGGRIVLATAIEAGEEEEEEEDSNGQTDYSLLLVAAYLIFSGAARKHIVDGTISMLLDSITLSTSFSSEQQHHHRLSLSRKRHHSQLRLLGQFRLLFLLPALPPAAQSTMFVLNHFTLSFSPASSPQIGNLIECDLQVHIECLAGRKVSYSDNRPRGTTSTTAAAASSSSSANGSSIKWALRENNLTAEFVGQSCPVLCGDASITITARGGNRVLFFCIFSTFLATSQTISLRASEFDRDRLIADCNSVTFSFKNPSTSSASSSSSSSSSSGDEKQLKMQCEALIETTRRSPLHLQMQSEGFGTLLSPSKRKSKKKTMRDLSSTDDEDLDEGDSSSSSSSARGTRAHRRPVSCVDYLQARRRAEPALWRALQEFQQQRQNQQKECKSLERTIRKAAGAPPMTWAEDLQYFPAAALSHSAPTGSPAVDSAPVVIVSTTPAPDASKFVDPVPVTAPPAGGASALLAELAMRAKPAAAAPPSTSTIAPVSSSRPPAMAAAANMLAEMMAKRGGAATTVAAATSGKQEPPKSDSKPQQQQQQSVDSNAPKLGFRPKLGPYPIPADRSKMPPVPGPRNPHAADPTQQQQQQQVVPTSAASSKLPAAPTGMAAVLAAIAGKSMMAKGAAAPAVLPAAPAAPKEELKKIFWKKSTGGAGVFAAQQQQQQQEEEASPDEEQLRQFFLMSTAKKPGANSSGDSQQQQQQQSGDKQQQQQKKASSALSSNRKQAVGILLKKTRLSDDEFVSCVLSCDPRISHGEIVDAVFRSMPMDDEVKALAREKDLPDIEWTGVERCMFALAQIPNVRDRLQLLRSFSQMESAIESCQSSLAVIRTAAHILLNSGSGGNGSNSSELKDGDAAATSAAKFLGVILRFLHKCGNILNKGSTSLVSSAGFSMESLPLLAKTIAPNVLNSSSGGGGGGGSGGKKMSLLDIVHQQLQQQKQKQQPTSPNDPAAAAESFGMMALSPLPDLSPLANLMSRATRASFSQLSVQVAQLSGVVQRAQLEASRKISAGPGDRLAEVAAAIVQQHQHQVTSLMLTEQELSADIAQLLDFFGAAGSAGATVCDEQVLFTLIGDFCSDWVKTAATAAEALKAKRKLLAGESANAASKEQRLKALVEKRRVAGQHDDDDE